jgi:hypothetical protein
MKRTCDDLIEDSVISSRHKAQKCSDELKTRSSQVVPSTDSTSNSCPVCLWPKSSPFCYHNKPGANVSQNNNALNGTNGKSKQLQC